MYAEVINNPTLTDQIKGAADALATNAEWLRDNANTDNPWIPDHYKERENAVNENASSIVGLAQGVIDFQVTSPQLVDNPALCDKLRIKAEAISNFAGYLSNAPNDGPVITPGVADKRDNLFEAIQDLQALMEGYEA